MSLFTELGKGHLDIIKRGLDYAEIGINTIIEDHGTDMELIEDLKRIRRLRRVVNFKLRTIGGEK